MKEQKPKNKKLASKRTNAYVKYTGMGMQMLVTILVGTLGGRKLDQYFETATPWFTVSLALFSTFAALYFALRPLLLEDKDKNEKKSNHG